jgi:hypothetical protein
MKILCIVFIPSDESAEVLKMGEETLYLPSALVPAHFPPILRRFRHAVLSVWSNEINSFLPQLFVERIAVIRSIADEVLREFFGEQLLQRFLDKSYFMRRGGGSEDSARQAMSVCHCHGLRALSTFSFSHCRSPFLAEENIASMNDSERSSSRSLASSCRI